MNAAVSSISQTIQSGEQANTEVDPILTMPVTAENLSEEEAIKLVDEKQKWLDEYREFLANQESNPYTEAPLGAIKSEVKDDGSMELFDENGNTLRNILPDVKFLNSPHGVYSGFYDQYKQEVSISKNYLEVPYSGPSTLFHELGHALDPSTHLMQQDLLELTEANKLLPPSRERFLNSVQGANIAMQRESRAWDYGEIFVDNFNFDPGYYQGSRDASFSRYKDQTTLGLFNELSECKQFFDPGESIELFADSALNTTTTSVSEFLDFGSKLIQPETVSSLGGVALGVASILV